MIKPSRQFLDTLKFGDRVQMVSVQRDLGQWMVGTITGHMITVHQGKERRRMSKEDGGTLNGMYGCRAYLGPMES